MNIEDALYLWSKVASDPVVRLSYYKQQPFYSPLGNGDAGEGARARRLWTEQDMVDADRVGVLLGKMQRSDPESFLLVREYYGAYLDAPDDRWQRLAKINLFRKDKRKMYAKLRGIKDKLEFAAEVA